MRSLPIGRNAIRTKFVHARNKQKVVSRAMSLGRQLRIEPLEDRRLLATVTTNIDFTDPDDGLMTLREAIIATLPGGTVNFAPSLNSATITLNSDPGYREIAFSKNLTIDGGTAGLTIHAAANSRIFNISGGGSTLATLVGLTLEGGDLVIEGGAIKSTARLAMRDCIVQNNKADHAGGVYVQVTGGGATPRDVLKIEDCVFRDNQSNYGGRRGFEGAGKRLAA